MKTDRISDFTAAMVQQRIQTSSTESRDTGESGKVSFREALQNQTSGNTGDSLSFSKHAAARLDQRGISVSDGLMSDLEQAVSKARKKGSKEVAVIGSQGIFIVNVPNNVVVTTMTQEDMKDRILTNIDGAVIM